MTWLDICIFVGTIWIVGPIVVLRGLCRGFAAVVDWLIDTGVGRLLYDIVMIIGYIAGG